MIMARLRNLSTGAIVAQRVEKARSWWRRVSGLLPYARIAPDDGLWFDRCSAIHTLGMRSKIDAIFLDEADRVLSIRYAIPRHCLAVSHRGARAVVELGAIVSATREVRIGDRLALE